MGVFFHRNGGNNAWAVQNVTMIFSERWREGPAGEAGRTGRLREDIYIHNASTRPETFL